MTRARPSRPLAANLRRLRATRGMTVVELARRAGVGRATLTQIEAGEGNPTLETLYSLANVLGAPLADLIAEAPSSPEPHVVRRGSGERAAGTAVDAWLLQRRQDDSATLEIYAIQIRPGVPQVSDPHPSGTREFLHVHSGNVVVGPVARPLELSAGDYADYAADGQHQYLADGDHPAVATLCIVSPVNPPEA